MTTLQQLNRIKAYIDLLVELPEHQVEVELHLLQKSEPQLAALIGSLLQRNPHESGGDTEISPIELESRGSIQALDGVLEPGHRLGSFTIEGLIGMGGMGAVYLARRGDDLQGKVALKTLTHWSHQRRSAFYSECKLLSALEHPNIARFIDVGEIREGWPWMALEFVEGETLDAYVRKHSLTVKQCIDLCLQICDALTHAHSQMIIHRDLKPSNIMVTAEGRVKLLDFGIALLLDSETGAQQTATLIAERLMTPAYASPEQLLGRRLSAASDVYSLGLVFYEMLTHQKPYSFQHHHPLELVDKISNFTIAKPSTRIDPSCKTKKRISKQLRGDLDTIVMKALEQDRGRRYSSVASMADDLRCFLSGKPISARPATNLYRLRKYVTRHPWPVAMATLSILFLLGFSFYADHQSRRNAYERDIARKERQTALAVTHFLRNMFSMADPDLARDGEITAFQILEGGREQLVSLQGERAVMVELEQAMAEVYQSLGKYQIALDLYRKILANQQELGLDGFETQLHLADVHIALGEHYAAEKILTSFKGEIVRRDAYQRTCFWHALAKFHMARGHYLDAGGSFKKALAAEGYSSDQLLTLKADQAGLLFRWGYFEKALAQWTVILTERRAFLGDRHSTVAESWLEMARCYEKLGAYEEAETCYLRAGSIYGEIYSEDHPKQAEAKLGMASLKQAKGEFDAAEHLYREALAIREKALGKEHPLTTSGYAFLGSLLVQKGEYEAAEEFIRRALYLQEGRLGKNHVNVADSIYELATLYYRKGDFAYAKIFYTKCRKIRVKALGEDHPDTGRATTAIGIALNKMGKVRAALPYFEEGLSITERALGLENPQTALAMFNLGGIFYEIGDLHKALLLWEQSLEVMQKVYGQDHPLTASVTGNIGIIYSRMNDQTRALTLFKEVLEIKRKTLGEKHQDIVECLMNIGNVLTKMGSYQEAHSYYDRALAMVTEVMGEEHSLTAKCLKGIGDLQRKAGDPNGALTSIEKALAIKKKMLGMNHPVTADSLNSLGLVLRDKGDLQGASENFAIALSIVESALGKNHEHTKKYRQNLESVLAKLPHVSN